MVLISRFDSKLIWGVKDQLGNKNLMFEIHFENWFGPKTKFGYCSCGFRILQKTGFCRIRLSELCSLKRAEVSAEFA